ncbi:MAG: methylated-DNA--[protein]-cysteine S-methyltransferase, partial [Myxococcota bacterium]
MTASGIALFETAIGSCGIAWGERGVVGVQLPEARESDARALLRGEARDLRDVRLDMEGVPAFDRRVYEVARSIPPGATL